MKAVVKTRLAAGFDLKDIPIPSPGTDEVLIRVINASICGSDLHLYNWDGWAEETVKTLPVIAGHEFCGIVERVGFLVKMLNKGDFVSAESHIFCGTCPVCLERNFHLCPNTQTIGFNRDGCFAEYVVLPEKIIWKNDPAVVPADIASIQEPLGNAVYCVLIEDVAGKTVAVFGDGPAGLFAAEVARASGAAKVMLVGIEEIRLGIGRELGARVIDARLINPVLQIKQMTGGLGADVVLEMSGAETAIKQAILSIKPGGRLCAFGITPEKTVKIDWNKLVFSGIKIYGIHGRQIFDSWIKIRNFLKARSLNLKPIITHAFPLEKFDEAFKLALSRKCGKILLHP